MSEAGTGLGVAHRGSMRQRKPKKSAKNLYKKSRGKSGGKDKKKKAPATEEGAALVGGGAAAAAFNAAAGKAAKVKHNADFVSQRERFRLNAGYDPSVFQRYVAPQRRIMLSALTQHDKLLLEKVRRRLIKSMGHAHAHEGCMRRAPATGAAVCRAWVAQQASGRLRHACLYLFVWCLTLRHLHVC